eukprot:2686783-Amphidinium_carterae.1
MAYLILEGVSECRQLNSCVQQRRGYALECKLAVPLGQVTLSLQDVGTLLQGEYARIAGTQTTYNLRGFSG